MLMGLAPVPPRGRDEFKIMSPCTAISDPSASNYDSPCLIPPDSPRHARTCQQAHEHCAHCKLVQERQEDRGFWVAAAQHDVQVHAAKGVREHRHHAVPDVAELLWDGTNRGTHGEQSTHREGLSAPSVG